MRFHLEYSETNGKESFVSAERLQHRLSTIHENSDKVTAVQLHQSGGGSLQILLGASVSSATFFPNNYAASGVGSQISIGKLTSPNSLDYWFCGYHSEVSSRNLVSLSAVFKAVAEFLEDSSHPPESIEWESE